MRHRLDALGWILGVEDSGAFVERQLGVTWHHARSERRDRFAELLSLAELDEVLGTYGVRHPGIKLVKLDEEIPRAEYLWRGDLVDPLQVARLFAGGATVIFGSLHDRHEGLRRLCADVTHQFSARSQTNIYLTPPGSQGFRPHWDTHDVFVLQVEGSKRWRIYGGGPDLPLKDQKFDGSRHDPGEVTAELTLQAGEVLYVPRGVMHAAETTGETSLHITLGVMSYTWADLLVDAVSELVERSPEWRANLPFGFARTPEGVAAAKSGLGALEENLMARVDLATVLAERQSSFDSVFRPRTTDSLRQVTAASSLGPNDCVRWRPGVPGRVDRRDGRLVLRSAGREVDFPLAAGTVLERVLDGGPILAGKVDDGLSWESCRVVLSALIREGWMAKVPHEAPPSQSRER